MKNSYEHLYRWIGFVFLLAFPLHAQFFVSGHSPQSYSNYYLVSDSVSIDFSEIPDKNSIVDNIFISGQYSGHIDFKYSVVGSRISLYDIAATVSGEKITVCLLNGLRAKNGDLLNKTYTFEFFMAYSQGNFFTEFSKMQMIPIGVENPHNSFLTALNVAGDDNPDIILGNSEDNTITIFTNVSTAVGQSFRKESTYTVGDRPVMALGGDFDDDGENDIAVICYNSNEVYFFWGNGTEYLSSPTILKTGFRPVAATILDATNDGIPDIAVLMSGEDKVTIYKSNGDRTFSSYLQLITAQSPVDMAVADLNLDGQPDILIAQGSPRSIAWWRGAGNQFIKEQEVTLEKRPSKILIANSRSNISAPEVIVSANDVPVLGKNNAVEKNHIYLINYDDTSGKLDLSQTITSEGSIYSLGTANLDASYNTISELLTGEYDKGVLSSRKYDNGSFAVDTTIIYNREYLRDFLCLDFNGDGAADIASIGHFSKNIDYLGTSFPRIGLPKYIDAIDFGEVFVTQSKTVGFTVSSKSTRDMNVSARVIYQNTVYSVLPTEFILPALDTQKVEITFKPIDPIPYDGYMEISSVDGLFETIRINLTGRGIRPQLVISPEMLDFGVVPEGESKEMSLQLKNTGNTTLEILGIENMHRDVFDLNTRQFRIEAGNSVRIYAKFTPSLLNGAFIDTFNIQTNDPLKSVSRVPLKGKSSNKPPVISGPDSIVVHEHSGFKANYSAIDPDHEAVTMEIREDISWVNVFANNEVRGTAPEGAGDEDFWVYASDGYLTDSLHVNIYVIPVNDPPRISGPSRIEVYENETVGFRVSATDPENDSLSLSVRNLPQGALFDPESGDFTWDTGFTDAGQYDLLFICREINRPVPLYDSLNVRIIVKDRLPDIFIEQLNAENTSLTVFKEVSLKLIFANRNAPLTGTFKVRIKNEGMTVWDTSMTSMQPGQTITRNIPVRINKVGVNKIIAELDYQNAIVESNEDNNKRELIITGIPGTLVVRPNPFTPNNDMKNDRAVFDMSRMAFRNPQLFIYDINGNKVRVVAEHSGDFLFWNGKDDHNKTVLPGLYLYILKDGQEELARGMIVVAL